MNPERTQKCVSGLCVCKAVFMRHKQLAKAGSRVKPLNFLDSLRRVCYTKRVKNEIR